MEVIICIAQEMGGMVSTLEHKNHEQHSPASCLSLHTGWAGSSALQQPCTHRRPDGSPRPLAVRSLFPFAFPFYFLLRAIVEGEILAITGGEGRRW